MKHRRGGRSVYSEEATECCTEMCICWLTRGSLYRQYELMDRRTVFTPTNQRTSRQVQSRSRDVQQRCTGRLSASSA